MTPAGSGAEAASPPAPGPPPAEGRDPGAGRIPFTLRVGVTGHRSVEDPDAVRTRIGAALARAKELVGPAASPIVFKAISSLAEGADRLVAEVVLGTGDGTLEAALPLDPDDYRSDFSGPASAHHFDALVARAVLVVAPPPHESRDEAYERVGEYVVDRCDVLVAVWDGEPSRGRGGTAEIVAYALGRRVPVLVVPATGGKPAEDLGDAVPGPAFAACGVARGAWRPDPEGVQVLPLTAVRRARRELDRYNTTRLAGSRLGAEQVAAAVAEEVAALTLGDDGYGERLGQPARWILPYFVRADRCAIAFQSLSYRLVTVGFLAAAMAVLTVASVTLFARGAPEYAALELIFLGLIITVFMIGRHWRLHERWISARFLAERLRSAIFLKAAGLSSGAAGGFDSVNRGDQSDEWLRRAYAYVWDACPGLSVPPAEVAGLREFLVRSWIRPQVDYHSRASTRHRTRYRVLTWTSGGLFVLTAAVALVHATSKLAGHESALALGSIALPAFGSAFAGISASRQYQRNATVYRRMAISLRAAQGRMERARTLGEVQATAIEVDDVMGDENRDWLGVMKFNDFEIAG